MKLIPRDEFKALAKELKQQMGIKSCHAHELAAKQLGYNSYAHYLSILKINNDK